MDVILMLRKIERTSPAIYKYYLIIETGDHLKGTIIEWGFYYPTVPEIPFVPWGRKNTIESAVSYAVRKISKGYEAVMRLKTEIIEIPRETYQIIRWDTDTSTSNIGPACESLELQQAMAKAISLFSPRPISLQHLVNGETVYANLYENGVKLC
jgi:hypothetical protein